METENESFKGNDRGCINTAIRRENETMPFIDSKVTVKMSEDKKEQIKAKLGQAIGLLGKTESFLMVGFEDEYDLYMGGKKLDKGAFVSVKVFGQLQSGACDSMTAKICDILQEELGIPGNAVYVTYQGINDWGWNGSNF